MPVYSYAGMYSYKYESANYGAVEVCLPPRSEGKFNIDVVEEIS